MPSSRWNSPKNTKLLIFLGATLPLLAGCQACRNLKGGKHTPRAQHEPEVEIRRTPPDANIDPGGIPNVGNTCYMNSLLQLLKLYPKSSIDSNTGEVADGLKALLDKIRDDKDAPSRAEAERFYQALVNEPSINWDGTKGQEDPSELLVKLANHLSLPPTITTKMWKERKNGTTEYHQENDASGKKVDAVDTNHLLKLPMTADKTNMQEYLDAYFEWQDLDAKEVKRQKARIASISDTLLIQLKRYKKDMAGNLTKISDPVDSPLSITIKAAHTTDGTARNYTLKAFVLQGGALASGHYTAYILDGTQWKEYNDERVTKAKDIMAKQAYLLLYQKKS